MILLFMALLGAPIHVTSNPDMCIDIPSGDAAPGAKLQLWNCNGTPAQDFTVENAVIKAPAPAPAPAPVNGSSSNSTQYSMVDPGSPQKDGYHLIFSDEFDGKSLDLTKWNLITDGSGGGNNELEYYVPFAPNHYLKNSLLTIHAQQQSFMGKPWTSAKLTTQGTFDFTFGYVEWKAKIPNGQGAWPALWLMPKDNLYGVWPTSGEIDVMEILGGNPSTLYGTLHYGKPWPNQQQIGGQSVAQAGTDYSQDFHTYGVDWQQDHMDFYVDGKVYYTVKSSDATWGTDVQSGVASTGSNGWPFSDPFFLIMNLAVGGAWPGAPDPKYSSFDFQIDYVRVYARN